MVEQINAAGGIDGHMLEAIIYDSEGDPAKAVSAVNKLIHKDQVIAIIGPSTTPTTLAIVNFIKKGQSAFDQLCCRHPDHHPGGPLGFQNRPERSSGCSSPVSADESCRH